MPLFAGDPIDWELDDNNDLIIPLRYTRGLPGVTQGIRIALGMIRGEWFANLDKGMPYLETEDGVVAAADAILAEQYNEVKIAAAVREAILGVFDVVSILALDLSFDSSTREATVSWQARTTFGDTPVETTPLTLEA